MFLVCLNAQETPSAAPQTYEISGTVKNGKTLLPGVTVTASNTLTGKKYATVTSTAGTFALMNLPRGRYVVRLEFMGFAAQTQEVVLKPETPAGKVEAELVLASRQQEQQAEAATQSARRGFQSLAVNSNLAALSSDNSAGGPGGNSPDASAMPMNGLGADSATESVSISGAQGRTQDFGSGSEQDLEDRIQEFRDRMQREGGGNLQTPGQGGAGSGGGPGGAGGGGFGGGPVAIMRIGGRGFNINEPHGFLYFQDDNSAFDARPYSLTGIASGKATYNQAKFGANAGGPLNIPKIFNGGNK